MRYAMEKRKTSFGVIVGTRGIFNSAAAAADRKKLLKTLDDLQFSYCVTPEKDTTNGGIETRKDAELCAALFRKHADEIDGVIVSLPNFGDEIAVIETIRKSRLNVPILVQASEDDIEKVDIYSRRDAFCGKISVCNNLYQYGYSYTETSEHTENPDSEIFKKDLLRFASVCRVVNGVRSARIGMIGTRPAAFQTVRFSEKLLQKNGITVVPADLSTLFIKAEALEDQDSGVQKKLAELKGYGNIPERITEEQLLRSVKFSAVVEEWLDENDCDASAIQCWNAMELNYGCAACVTMSMMSEALRPSACEADVTGALSMYVLSLASQTPAALLDWNNNYGKEKDVCVNTHCSNFPKSFVGNEIEISELDLLGENLGREIAFGAVKGKVSAGPATFLRLSTDDRHGKMKGYTGTADFTDDPFAMDGGIAVVKVPKLRELLQYICKQGFEHHVAMSRGCTAAVIEEALQNYLGWDIFVHT